MNQTQPVVQKMLRVLKALLAAYLLTTVCLMILAFLLLKLDLNEGNVNIGIIITYLLSCFLGGFILLVISAIAYQGMPSVATHVITTMLLCVGGGMGGGMLS